MNLNAMEERYRREGVTGWSAHVVGEVCSCGIWWWMEGEFLWREGYLKKRLDIVNRFRGNKTYLTLLHINYTILYQNFSHINSSISYTDSFYLPLDSPFIVFK